MTQHENVGGDETVAGDVQLRGVDMTTWPRERRLAHTRRWLGQLAEDDYTDCGFVVEAARALVGVASTGDDVRDAVIELYLSFVRDENVAVLDPTISHRYVDADRLRADILAGWQGGDPLPHTMPWLTWRADDSTPPGP